MKRMLFPAAVLFTVGLLFACGGSMSPSNVTNGVRMSVTIGDMPPSGVAVLFFEASITGVSLQPSDSKKPAVSVLMNPVELEFGHLQTDTAFLSLAKVTPDTYSSLTLTLGNAEVTIVNRGAPIGSCLTDSLCQLTPNFSTSMVTLSGMPFPITIDMNSVVGIKLDLNVNSSVQGDLSINPSVTIAHLTQRQDSDEDQEMAQLDELDGQITARGTNQFTLVDRRNGQSFTVNVDSNTVFQDFDRAGCMASPQDFSCLATNQIVEVKLSENGMGTMLATRVEFIENASQEAIQGNHHQRGQPQFHMVVLREEPSVNGISEGAPIAVTIAPNAVFQIGSEEMGEDGGFSMVGFSFASSADLMVGQDVQVRPGMVSSSNGGATLTTDLVRLWPSQITGQVASINGNNGTFSLSGLSPLFTGATPPVNTITVMTLSNMDFQDFPNQGQLAVGNTVSVKGLLFNTATTPTLVTRTIEDHQ